MLVLVLLAATAGPVQADGGETTPQLPEECIWNCDDPEPRPGPQLHDLCLLDCERDDEEDDEDDEDPGEQATHSKRQGEICEQVEDCLPCLGSDTCDPCDGDPLQECLQPRYDENENEICGPHEPAWLQDTDGDGELDCLDNDDDGDYLTDKLEDQHLFYAQKQADNDGDGVVDSYDLLPDNRNPKVAGIDVPTLDLGDTGCDGPGSEPADPFVTTFHVWFGHVDPKDGVQQETKTMLAKPTGWTKEHHLHNRPKDAMDPGWSLKSRDAAMVGPGAIDEGKYTLPHDVRAFGIDDEGDAPAIGLAVGLQDHDGHAGGGEETIDLEAGDDTEAAWTYELGRSGEIGSETIPKGGTDECHADIKGAFDDLVPTDAIPIAAYHADHPGEMIYTDTV